MAELEKDNSLLMREIEQSIEQVLDTQEDEEVFPNSNAFFNETNSRSNKRSNDTNMSKNSK